MGGVQLGFKQVKWIKEIEYCQRAPRSRNARSGRQQATVPCNSVEHRSPKYTAPARGLFRKFVVDVTGARAVYRARAFDAFTLTA